MVLKDDTENLSDTISVFASWGTLLSAEVNMKKVIPLTGS